MNAIPEFAKGGFPEPGEFFMCRGEGAPEMVGKFNNYATGGICNSPIVGNTNICNPSNINNSKLINAISDAVAKSISDAINNQPYPFGLSPSGQLMNQIKKVVN